MKWLLIFMSYWDGQVMAIGNGLFDTHMECFTEREKLGGQTSGRPGYFPLNLQAICMQVEVDE